MKSAGRVVSAVLMAASFVLAAIAIILFGTAAHANDSTCVRLISHPTAATVRLAPFGARPALPDCQVATRFAAAAVEDANENDYHPRAMFNQAHIQRNRCAAVSAQIR